jgi:hypothetical protein
LCGIADEPFWLANLGAREMAELDGDLVAGRGEERLRRDPLGVAIALHDLGRGRLEPDAEALADRLLHRRLEVRERADRARDLADGGLRGGAREALAPAPHRFVEHEQLQAERGGLRVDAVRAPDRRRVAVLLRARAERRGERVGARDEQRSRVPDLERLRRVDHVVRRHPEVDEPRLRADVLGDVGEERDHVMADLRLDLGDARGVEAGARADRARRLGGDDAALGEHLAHRHLHLEPPAETAVVGPDGRHRGAAVALDHRGWLRSAQAAVRKVYASIV